MGTSRLADSRDRRRGERRLLWLRASSIGPGLWGRWSGGGQRVWSARTGALRAVPRGARVGSLHRCSRAGGGRWLLHQVCLGYKARASRRCSLLGNGRELLRRRGPQALIRSAQERAGGRTAAAAASTREAAIARAIPSAPVIAHARGRGNWHQWRGGGDRGASRWAGDAGGVGAVSVCWVFVTKLLHVRRRSAIKWNLLLKFEHKLQQILKAIEILFYIGGLN